MSEQAAAAANRKGRVHVLGLMLCSYRAPTTSCCTNGCWITPLQTLPLPAEHPPSGHRKVSLISNVISSEALLDWHAGLQKYPAAV
jgi:hypothetical protein